MIFPADLAAQSDCGDRAAASLFATAPTPVPTGEVTATVRKQAAAFLETCGL